MTENIEPSDEQIRKLFIEIAEDELYDSHSTIYPDTWVFTLKFKNKYGLEITPAIGFKKKLFKIKAMCDVFYAGDINSSFFEECPFLQSPLLNDVQSKLPLTYEQVCDYIVKLKYLPEGGKLEKVDLSSKLDKLLEILGELVKTQKELIEAFKKGTGNE